MYLRCEDTGMGIVLKEDNPENGFSFRQENPIEEVINNIAPAPLPKPISEPCRYCGGDCPNQPNYMCDGYSGDIDNLYEEEES